MTHSIDITFWLTFELYIHLYDLHSQIYTQFFILRNGIKWTVSDRKFILHVFIYINCIFIYEAETKWKHQKYKMKHSKSQVVIVSVNIKNAEWPDFPCFIYTCHLFSVLIRFGSNCTHQQITDIHKHTHTFWGIDICNWRNKNELLFRVDDILVVFSLCRWAWENYSHIKWNEMEKTRKKNLDDNIVLECTETYTQERTYTLIDNKLSAHTVSVFVSDIYTMFFCFCSHRFIFLGAREEYL